MEEYINQVMEIRIKGIDLSTCLQETANWLKNKEQNSNFYIEGIFIWADTEYGDWYSNVYYTERIYD